MASSDQGGTQAQGFWTDPATNLMWAAKDNGKDVSWKKAKKYCRGLRLAGYSDWRLASIEELKGIYDKNANAPGLMGPSDKSTVAMWHVKGNIFLTENQWSSTQVRDDSGRPSAYVWYFDFNEGRSNNDPTGFPYPYNNMRALCVRDSGK